MLRYRLRNRSNKRITTTSTTNSANGGTAGANVSGSTARRLLRLLPLFFLLVASLGLAAPVARAQTGGCGTAIPTPNTFGMTHTAGALRVDEVRGYWDIGSHFYPCAPTTGASIQDSVSVSVGIRAEPGPNGRVAMGIYSCDNLLFALPCGGQGVRRYFGEASGCGFSNYFNFGSHASADDPVRLRIALQGGQVNYYRLKNGHASELLKQVPQTDPSVSCWINTNTRGEWLGQILDEGDSTGDLGNETRLTFAEYKVPGGVLTGTDWSPFTNPCTYPSGDTGDTNQYCDILVYDAFDLWTVDH